jgi:hypothetical protein
MRVERLVKIISVTPFVQIYTGASMCAATGAFFDGLAHLAT